MSQEHLDIWLQAIESEINYTVSGIIKFFKKRQYNPSCISHYMDPKNTMQFDLNNFTFEYRPSNQTFKLHAKPNEVKILKDNEEAVISIIEKSFKKLFCFNNEYISVFHYNNKGNCRSCVVITDTPREPDENKNIFVVAS